MDSLAVSVTGGALIQNYRHHHMLKIGCVMGIFQAGMTIAGYLAGMSFKKYITAFDHWIAFLLLLYLGGKMIYESTQEKEEDCRTNPLCYKTLCGLGIATSIDALAVGRLQARGGGRVDFLQTCIKMGQTMRGFFGLQSGAGGGIGFGERIEPLRERMKIHHGAAHNQRQSAARVDFACQASAIGHKFGGAVGFER